MPKKYHRVLVLNNEKNFKKDDRLNVEAIFVLATIEYFTSTDTAMESAIDPTFILIWDLEVKYSLPAIARLGLQFPDAKIITLTVDPNQSAYYQQGTNGYLLITPGKDLLKTLSILVTQLEN